jgi:hypothetical protein
MAQLERFAELVRADERAAVPLPCPYCECVEDMQKIMDANEKLVKELKDYEIHGK